MFTLLFYDDALTIILSVFHALYSFQAHVELLDRMTHALEEELLLHNEVLQRRRGAGEVHVVRRRALLSFFKWRENCVALCFQLQK